MKKNAWLGRMLCWFVVLLGISTGIIPATANAAPVLGTKKVMVLRVYFHDYAATSRYTQPQTQGFFANLDTLWQHTSYTKINISSVVTTLYQLPDNRSLYIDDFASGDLSNGSKFWKVLEDAIDNAPGGLDWTNVDAVMVVMAETDPSQFHRGQATTGCSLKMGPGGATKSVGCAIFSENPASNDNQVWGRWAHEMGHAFQQAGPAHPSNYNSDFELMDANYPGQTGVFEKQNNTGFPGWMPASKYHVIPAISGGDVVSLWAEEYDPTFAPNEQAAKVEITGSFYYLVSVRRRVLGDDLNGNFTPFGIPSEGVLIERVVEGADPWVKVIGRGANASCAGATCNRQQLWQNGDQFNSGEGIFMTIQNVDNDHYNIRISKDMAPQPDVMLNPWTAPPGNTWETTDIWVDSPVNAYGTFRYGMWNDGTGNLVPRGNGDDPAVGQVNRLYARVRNVGSTAAINVVANWEVTNPLGVGIAGASGWVTIGSVDKTSFPGLASIAPGSFVDVYTNWTPAVALTPAQIAAGTFPFHTCVRVNLNHVAGETVFDNQDGNREQENFSYFQVPPAGAPAAIFNDVIHLRNDDKVKPKIFYLGIKSDLPSDWKFDFNNGQKSVELKPDELVDLPIKITPGSSARKVGTQFAVDVSASSMRLLVNDLDPKDLHPEFTPLGGVRVAVNVLNPTKLRCLAGLPNVDGLTLVTGQLDGISDFYPVGTQGLPVQIIGLDKNRNFIPSASATFLVARDGSFKGQLLDRQHQATEFSCLFAGTDMLMTSSSGFTPFGDQKDSDGDGVPDYRDNCINVPNPDQRDTNGDGYGNMCDGDLNNDGATNTIDLNIYKAVHRSKLGDPNYNPDADFNGDGAINTIDLNIYKGLHRKPPGPSGLAP